MWTTYWFEIIGEDSDLCGEEFFVEIQNAFDARVTEEEAIAYAQRLFPNEELDCHGMVTEFEAEMMGLDTY